MDLLATGSAGYLGLVSVVCLGGGRDIFGIVRSPDPIRTVFFYIIWFMLTVLPLLSGALFRCD